jgi:hypothetical protein
MRRRKVYEIRSAPTNPLALSTFSELSQLEKSFPHTIRSPSRGFDLVLVSDWTQLRSDCSITWFTGSTRFSAGNLVSRFPYPPARIVDSMRLSATLVLSSVDSEF